MVKLEKIDTYLGELRVGDEVKISWRPNTDRVTAIHNVSGRISLCFDLSTDLGNSYSGGGNILGKNTLKRIIKATPRNWNEIIGTDSL